MAPFSAGRGRCAAWCPAPACVACLAPPALLHLAGQEAWGPCCRAGESWRFSPCPLEPGCLLLRSNPGCLHLRPHPFMSGLRVPGAPAPGSGCCVTLNSPPRGPGCQLTAHLTDLLLSLPSLSRSTCELDHFSPASLVCHSCFQGILASHSQTLYNQKGSKARGGLSRH